MMMMMMGENGVSLLQQIPNEPGCGRIDLKDMRKIFKL